MFCSGDRLVRLYTLLFLSTLHYFKKGNAPPDYVNLIPASVNTGTDQLI